jgi:hypothetical protein
MPTKMPSQNETPKVQPETAPLKDTLVSSEEWAQAKAQGLPLPGAGLPDFKAIKKAFGFGPEDIIGHSPGEGVKSAHMLVGKKSREPIGDTPDWHGAHDDSGADTSI